MKKTLALIIALSCLLMLAACSTGTANPSASPSASDSVQPADSAVPDAAPEARTTLTVGFDAEFPPYGYMDDNGDYVGFDLDLAAEVCTRNGWELVKRPIDWDAKDYELDSGAIDCIWNGFTMSEVRLSQYTWSDPYVDNHQVFVVRADSGIVTQADLAGKVVDVQAASSAADALGGEEELTASFSKLIEVADYNTAFMDLESGAVDAIAMDIAVAQFQIEGRENEFAILEEALVAEQYGVGFKLGNTELKDIVQNTLLDMVNDGTFKTISDKWGLTDSVILGK